MPIEASFFLVASPIPLMAPTGSGARKVRSVPGKTTVRPRGFSRSEAIFATVLFTPMPIEQVIPRADTRDCTRRQMSTGLSRDQRPGVTSKNASSIDTCSTSGVSSSRSAMTFWLISRYRAKLPWTQIAWGHSRSAW